MNKQEREKAKTIRDKETTIVKQYNKNKKKKIQKKKELKLQIQNLKKAIKSENSKENVGPLTERLQKVNAELAELENSLVLEEMEFLQTKIKVKKEKCDSTV